MVEYSATRERRLSAAFFALADPTRRAIVQGLARSEPMRVTDLAARFPVSLNAVSKHLKILERSGLLRRDVVGRVHYCSLDPGALTAASTWLEEQQRFWGRRLDELQAFFETRRAAAGQPRPKRGARRRRR